MLRKFLLPVLALAGFCFAVWLVFEAAKPVPASKPVTEPPQPPYRMRISGSGIVEASTRNIAVGTQVSGVVTAVTVRISQSVKAGDPLFVLDDRVERAALAVKEAALAEAEARLTRLLQAPRKEEVPVVRARVREAEAALEDFRHQLKRAEEVHDPRAISIEDLTKRRFAVHAAAARLVEAQADLALLEAGSWKADITVARAQVQRAAAEVRAAEVEIERLTVRSPVNGRILQVNIRPGEFAQGGALTEPLMLLGNTERLHVRVDVDENDAWRFTPHSRATAFVRGNPRLKTGLTFEYIEPYVIPKRSLTGDSTERVDTRVMQIVYSFPGDALNVYPGQLMDVYIEDAGESIPPTDSSSEGAE
jgi:multidrug resistance efflux pump